MIGWQERDIITTNPAVEAEKKSNQIPAAELGTALLATLIRRSQSA